MSTIPYAIDSSVFIEAHRRYYSFSICPGFWQAVVRHHETAQLCSIDRVYTELTQTQDALCNWAKTEISSNFFHSTTDASVVASFAAVVHWVQASAQFSHAAKTQFLSGADPWLVAHCITHQCTLVTQEVVALQARTKVPIPNVCLAFKVATCDTFQLLGRLQASFHLSY